MEAPKPPTEEKRLEALRSYGILDTPREPVFDEYTQLASYICQAPIAIINLVDANRQWFKSEIGLGVSETPLDISICAHAILQPGLFVVPDTFKDDRFRNNPLCLNNPNLRFYAGALLETADGLPLGTLCVLDRVPRELKEEQGQALLTLARSIVTMLELRRTTRLQLEVIREREKAEEEAARARDAALEANRAKSSFLARMSHELRTPLNAIIGYSELLTDMAAEMPPDEVQADLGRITSSANHLLSLIDSVLDLSKIEAGRMELQVETFALDELLNEAAQTVAPQVQRSETELVISGADDAGQITADRQKLLQVLLNLLSNASKFTREGRIEITARWSAPAGDGRWFEIDVTDSGPGISPADQVRLFEEFSQGPQPDGDGASGTGLGLPISRKLCELMGGTLRVKSRLGEGATFTVRLPAGREQERVAGFSDGAESAHG